MRMVVAKIHANFPKLKIIDGKAGMAFRRMEGGHHHHGGHHDDDHDYDHDHDHDEDDPHVWLSIENMKCHARTVAAVLAEVLPESEHAAIDARAAEYLRELDALSAELKAKLSLLKGTEGAVGGTEGETVAFERHGGGSLSSCVRIFSG